MSIYSSQMEKLELIFVTHQNIFYFALKGNRCVYLSTTETKTVKYYG